MSVGKDNSEGENVKHSGTETEASTCSRALRGLYITVVSKGSSGAKVKSGRNSKEISG